MNQPKEPMSDLITAVTAFDDELDRFAKLTDAARKAPLNSQKNLQRAARVFQEIGEAEQALADRGQALVAALASARGRQEAQAGSIEERAKEFGARTEVAAKLLGEYAELGQDTARLSTQMQELAANNSEVLSTTEISVGFRSMAKELAGVTERAQALTQRSREADFEDIARQVDSLRQQTAALHDKLLSLEIQIRPD